jgi:predicted nicotinamide N-methyase
MPEPTPLRTLEEAKALIRRNARPIAVPGLPITLWQADELAPIWQATQSDLDDQNLPPPFWAFAWAGGQAMARWIFEHPETVAGRRVLDLAAGSGLIAIAAALNGAEAAFANDIDVMCAAAVALNAELNQVDIGYCAEDLLGGPPPDVDVVFAGDVFYEKAMAQRFLAFLLDARLAGADVYVGDPGRTFFPRESLRQLAEYQVETSLEIESTPTKSARVWTF